MSVIYIYVLE